MQENQEQLPPTESSAQAIPALQREEGSEQAPSKTPQEQAQDAVKIAKKLAQGENMLLEREIWAYMNALTAPGVNENKKYLLKKSMARAIQFGVNFMGGGMEGVSLQNFGQLAKIENNLARAIVKLAETNTLVMADNLRQMEEAQENNEGVKPLSELQSASVDGKDPVVTGPDSAE